MPRFSATPPIDRPGLYKRPVKQDVNVDIVRQGASGDEASMAVVPKVKAKGSAKPKSKTKVKPEPNAAEATDGDEDEGGAEAKARGGYDRALLVNLVAKASKADWTALAYAVNKSASQCRDTWRKTVFPALIDGRAWAVAGPGWDVPMKLHLAREVLGTARPEWAAIATSFPGRTPAQVHDVWRKVVLPRLMSGKILV